MNLSKIAIYREANIELIEEITDLKLMSKIFTNDMICGDNSFFLGDVQYRISEVFITKEFEEIIINLYVEDF